MGFYVNPENEAKELFLRREAERLPRSPASYTDIPTDKAAVCLVDNGMFTAAGIVFDQFELEEFANPDGRSKTWYLIDRSKLYDVSDITAERFADPTSAAAAA